MKSKSILLFTLVCSCFLTINSRAENINSWCIKNLKSDSGFVQFKETYEFLLLTKTFNSNAYNELSIKNSDTTGKFYLVKNEAKGTRNAIICIEDYSYQFESHLIFLLTFKNNEWELTDSSRFFHGNYSCCWRKSMSGFGKLNQYYYIDICSTGSGTCASQREILFLHHTNTFFHLGDVPNSFFSSYMGEGQIGYYYSQFNVSGDTIIATYNSSIGQLPVDTLDYIDLSTVKYINDTLVVKYLVFDYSIIVINKSSFVHFFKDIAFFDVYEYLK